MFSNHSNAPARVVTVRCRRHRGTHPIYVLHTHTYTYIQHTCRHANHQEANAQVHMRKEALARSARPRHLYVCGAHTCNMMAHKCSLISQCRVHLNPPPLLCIPLLRCTTGEAIAFPQFCSRNIILRSQTSVYILANNTRF